MSVQNPHSSFLVTRSAMQIIFLVIIVALEASCGKGSQLDCAKQIEEEIRPGIPSEIADADLKKCGFVTTIDSAKKTLHGDKRVRNGVVIERTQVVINLKSDNTVATIRVTTGLIGP
jgi:hypothetical protein